jgi:hypothetical protein
MRIPRVLAVVGAAMTALSCTSTVQTDFDYQADFTSYSTFAWYQPSQDTGPTEGPSQLVDRRIRNAIAANLQLKGLEATEPGKADLLVAYYTSLSSHMRFHTTGWGYGWGWGGYWGYGYGHWPGWTWTTAHPYHEGTVIVDIVDRGKNQLVWRGVTTRVLGKKSHTDEKIDKSMNRVFADFPPV